MARSAAEIKAAGLAIVSGVLGSAEAVGARTVLNANAREMRIGLIIITLLSKQGPA